MMEWKIENKEEDFIYRGYIGNVRTCLQIDRFSDTNCDLYHDKRRFDSEKQIGGNIEILAMGKSFNYCKQIADNYCI